MQIFFRADGNSEIGLGHITRSMALAEMLSPEFEAIFLVQNPSKSLKAKITEAYELLELPATQNYTTEAEQIAQQYLSSETVIVLDGYHFRTDYQRTLKAAGAKVVCIDDLHAWHFEADAVINHAEGVSPQLYSCEPYTRLFLGIKYALLRYPFREAAKKRTTSKKSVSKVLICFGGADPLNLTSKMTELCLQVSRLMQVHVVLGSAYTFKDKFISFAQSHRVIQHHENLGAGEMCRLMQTCDVAITPASGIAYEVLATHTPWIGGYYTDNQRGIYEGLKVQQAIYGDLGDFRTLNTAYFLQMLHSEKLPNVPRLIDETTESRIKDIFTGLC